MSRSRSCRLGYEGLPEGEAAICERKPSEYLSANLYVDTMGFSPTGIEQCIELFGVERGLLGSDYPAVHISPKEHIDLVKGLGLSQEDEARILWKTAEAGPLTAAHARDEQLLDRLTIEGEKYLKESPSQVLLC